VHYHISNCYFCTLALLQNCYRKKKNAGRECVATALKLVIYSFSSAPQLSFTSGPYVRAGMDLYRRYAGLSPASKGSAKLPQSKHWSGGRRVCSAAPVIYIVAIIGRVQRSWLVETGRIRQFLCSWCSKKIRVQS